MMRFWIVVQQLIDSLHDSSCDSLSDDVNILSLTRCPHLLVDGCLDCSLDACVDILSHALSQSLGSRLDSGRHLPDAAPHSVLHCCHCWNIICLRNVVLSDDSWPPLTHSSGHCSSDGLNHSSFNLRLNVEHCSLHVLGL